MIKTVNGDIINFLATGRINSLIHCCNCQNVMSAGLAKALRQKWPQVYAVDRDYKLSSEILEVDILGRYSIAFIEEGNKLIYNCYGQRYYGRDKRHLDYEAFYNSISMVKQDIRDNEILGIPSGIGCGLAGGSWMVVQAMLEDVFGDLGGRVMIVEKKP